jgi:hypothetical protein
MQDPQPPTDLPSISDDTSPEPSAGPATNQAPDSTPQAPSDGSRHFASQATAVVPDEAADNDLIEKEWVIKAKQIVEQTRDNPYEQQKEIEKFKAEYMKKRYNKTIRTSDS